jgi:hypothetical protein
MASHSQCTNSGMMMAITGCERIRIVGNRIYYAKRYYHRMNAHQSIPFRIVPMASRIRRMHPCAHNRIESGASVLRSSTNDGHSTTNVMAKLDGNSGLRCRLVVRSVRTRPCGGNGC